MFTLKQKIGDSLDKLSFKIIDFVFRPMDRGHLTMKLPNGKLYHYGHGNEIQAQITVKDLKFFRKCVLFGAVGFGESYTDGDWETDNITSVIAWMILNYEKHPTMSEGKNRWAPVNFLNIFNKLYGKVKMNSITGSRKNIGAHYDLNNDFFKLFLDPTMTYSAAYFRSSGQSLEEAQLAKYDALCKKLRIQPDDHILEIGSGWGGFSIYAAKHYGCKITTITISKEQYKYAKARIRSEGLASKIDIQLKDYRHMTGKYDKIVSIEMIEAVGHKYLKGYFEAIQRMLKKDGLLALQMITFPNHRYEIARRQTDWIQKHIFPGSLLPSLKSVQQAIEKTGTLNLFDLEDITPDYVKTLKYWYQEFNSKIADVKMLGMDDAFIRKWNYYLCYCEAAFRMRHINVVHAVYSRPNNWQVNDALELELITQDHEFIEQL